MEKIKLGQEVKDRVTGYTGITVSVTTFLTGCDRYAVQKRFDPEKDNKPMEPEMFDEIDLEIIGCGILPPPPPPGGNPNFNPRKVQRSW